MLALIAGEGRLPEILAERLARSGETVLLCPVRGHEPAGMPDLPRLELRLERLGSVLKTFQQMGVRRVCMAGRVRRPDIDEDAIDAETRPLIARLVAAMARGDDGTLREFITLFEERGLTVVGADAVAPELLAPDEVLAGTLPDGVEADAAAGEAEVARMGAADSGQACLVEAGRVVAQEGPEGTDAMIEGWRAGSAPSGSDDPVGAIFDVAGEVLGNAADWLSGGRPAGAAILFKAPKPGQDRRVDLPTIGPDTVHRAAAAGLAGIVVEAGGVLIVDRDAALRAANDHGLFLWGRPRGGDR